VFTTVDATDVTASLVDATNLEVMNLKAKDGTAAGSIADTTGVVTLNSAVLTTADINGGTVDGTIIGGSSAAAITGTTITATSGFSGSLTGNATTATTATNIAGGAAGSVPYQTGSGATALLAAGTGVLVGGSTPSYSATPTLTGTNFSAIPNAALTNSAVTVGTTSISLGASSLTLGGLTSVAVTQDPVSNFQVATKQYVDTLAASGIHFHDPVFVESPDATGNLNATYNNGSSGVGATLTNAGTQVALTIDGILMTTSKRVLIYNQTNQAENGVYTVTTVGDGSTNWVLTRATDADTYAPFSPNSLGQGDAFFVTSGNTGAGETYICNTVGTITFGTTAITFAQISSSQVYSAGTGLTLTGTQFSLTAPVVVANGGTGLTSFTANGLVYASSTSALATGSALTFDGSSLASNVSTNGTAGISVTNTNTGVGSSSAVFLNNDSTAETQIFTFGANRVGTFFGQSVANYSAFLTAGSASNGILLGALTNKPVIFGVNDSEQMRLTSTGLGIGISSPTTKLDVNGTITATAYAGINGGTF
jgi:hypothetical protein